MRRLRCSRCIGLFNNADELFLRFAFDTVGVQRLEARAMAANVRANAVLRRMGSTGEGHLRRSFLLGGQYHDDWLWALLKTLVPAPIDLELNRHSPVAGGRVTPRLQATT